MFIDWKFEGISTDNPSSEEGVVRLSGGSIDYRHYDRRARVLRARRYRLAFVWMATACEAIIRTYRRGISSDTKKPL